jgi:tetratricopeptide (TPR) repeat protein
MLEDISLVLISKNEEAVLGRCLESLHGADQVVVLDTGSTDRTPEIVKAHGADLHVTEPIIPFHFAEARNRALTHARHDWCVTIDADEIVRPGSMKTIRRAIRRNPQANALNITFVMRGELNDTPYPIAKMKVFRRSAWEWRFRVHELLFPKKGHKPQVAEVPEASIEHLPVPDKSGRHRQNLDLLRLCVEESPEYARARRQLSLELMLRKEWGEAIPHMEEWLRLLAASGVDDPIETSEALCHIGECHAETGNLAIALLWFARAAGAMPNRREPHYRAAWWLIKNARLDDALQALDRMLAVPRSKRPKYHLSIEAAWKDDGEPRRMMEFCRAEIERAKAVLRAGSVRDA